LVVREFTSQRAFGVFKGAIWTMDMGFIVVLAQARKVGNAKRGF
jgi:hypothetical protein